MDHTEFSIALPADVSATRPAREWAEMKKRLQAVVGPHSGDANGVASSERSASSFLAQVTGHQIKDIARECGMEAEERGRFVQALRLVEDRCAPVLLILYNRFRFFTCHQKGSTAEFHVESNHNNGSGDSCRKPTRLLLPQMEIVSDDPAQTLTASRELEQSFAMADPMHSRLSPQSPKISSVSQPGCLNLSVAMSQTDQVGDESAYQEFESFYGELNMWMENCAFEGGHDKLLQDGIIRGVRVDADRHRLLHTDGLNLGKTLQFCRAAERSRRVRDVGVNTDPVGELSPTVQEASHPTASCTHATSKSANQPDLGAILSSSFFTTGHTELQDKSPDVETVSSDRNLEASERGGFIFTSQVFEGKESLDRNLPGIASLKVDSESERVAKDVSERCETGGDKTQYCRVDIEKLTHFTDLSELRQAEAYKATSRNQKFSCQLDKSAGLSQTSGGHKVLSPDFDGTGNSDDQQSVMMVDDSSVFLKEVISNAERISNTDEKHPSIKTELSDKKQLFLPSSCELFLPDKTSGDSGVTRRSSGRDLNEDQIHPRVATDEAVTLSARDLGSKRGRGSQPVKRKLERQDKQVKKACTQLVCSYCGAMFGRSNHLKEHIRLHTGDRSHMCDVCGAKFTEASKLRSHLRKHSGEKPYVCEVCTTGFSWSAALVRHMRTHTREKPYKCPTCERAFADLSTMTRHTRIHTGERPFPCDQCQQTFTNSSSLRRHQQGVHSGKKDFICDACGAGFAVRCDLMRHMKIHSGFKPFVCDICGAKFGEAAKLRRHLKIHNRLKPFMCDICNAKFREATKLKQHLKIHDVVSSFVCDICGAMFCGAVKLNRHVKTHNEFESLGCDICDAKFCEAEKLRRHLKLHAKPSVPEPKTRSSEKLNSPDEESKLTSLDTRAETESALKQPNLNLPDIQMQ